MERITRKNLDNVCEHLNRETNSPLTAWTRHADGRLTGNIGHWEIANNMRWYTLERVISEGGAVSTAIDVTGTARDVYDSIHTMLTTIRMIKTREIKL